MKRIADFALVAIAVILLIGMYLFKDYKRFEFERGAEGIMYMLDTRTGDIWITFGYAAREGEGHDIHWVGKAVPKSK